MGVNDIFNKKNNQIGYKINTFKAGQGFHRRNKTIFVESPSNYFPLNVVVTQF